MGRGDRKTRKGKIWSGTYGKYRPRKDDNQGVRQGKVKNEETRKNKEEEEKEKKDNEE